MNGSQPRFGPQDHVEVRNHFDGAWCTGFDVAEVVEYSGQTRYLVRRVSDGAVLPVQFAESDLNSRSL